MVKPVAAYPLSEDLFSRAYIIGGSLVAYQIGYVVDRCSRRQFQTLISQIMQINSIFEEFENLSVVKKTLSDLASNPSAVESVFFHKKIF